MTQEPLNHFCYDAIPKNLCLFNIDFVRNNILAYDLAIFGKYSNFRPILNSVNCCLKILSRNGSAA